MLERIIIGLVMTGGFGLTIYLMKRWLTRVEAKLDEQDKRYYDCREQLPKQYACKMKTQEEISKLWVRTDAHEKAISYTKGLRNGAKA